MVCVSIINVTVNGIQKRKILQSRKGRKELQADEFMNQENEMKGRSLTATKSVFKKD